MDYKKATIFGIINYAIIFFMASILFVTVSEKVMPFLMVTLSPIVIYYISRNYYFRKTEVSDRKKEGVLLGIYWLIIMTVIEVPVLVYGFWQGDWSQFWTWNMWVGRAEYVVFAYLAAIRA